MVGRLREPTRKALRLVLHALPEPARAALRAAWLTVRASTTPSSRQIAFPPDVADRESLRDYLTDTDLFGAVPQEGDAYLTDALERIRITMALVPAVPEGSRILELGANPYFITRLLRRRGLSVTCANYFGEGNELTRQVVTAPRSGERQVYEFDQFNVERDRFPYEDASFDLVLCCEILEHLPNDPVHMLAEIHRILAQPAGTLLLTTPNATRLTNLTRILRGENPYEELSGYGTYGRHNREYTVDELRRLLEGCGFHVDEVFAADIHNHDEPVPAVPGAETADRGDNLFAVARPHGEPRWCYPRWLYASQHGLRKVVRPDLAMGYNDQLQGTGFYDVEVMEGRPASWMGAGEARAVLAPDFAGPGLLQVDGIAPPSAAGDTIGLRAEVAGQKASWVVHCDGRPFSVSAPVVVEPGRQEACLQADQSWVPHEAGINDDTRTLSLAVSRVALLAA